MSGRLLLTFLICSHNQLSSIIHSIISPLVGSSPPDKYSCEIGRSFADPLTVHSLDPSIDSSRTKEMLPSEVIL